MDRDAVLAAALGAAVLAGCTTGSDPAPSPSTSPTPSAAPEDPDAAVLRAWLATEHRLAARYAGIVRQVPKLTALRRNHADRAEAVAAHLRTRGLPVETPAASGPPQGRPGAIVAGLVRREREAAIAYVTALPAVTDPRVAVLGAQLAAGARQHALALGLVEVPR